MRSNPLKAVIVAGATAVATLAPLALVSSAANATSGTATGTTITGRTTIATGQAATFTAVVAPTTVTPGPKPTGTVAFTITGHDASNVNCSGGDTVTVTKGKAKCKVASGSLSASASAYTVAAVYSGDGTFAGSTATPASVTVTLAKVTVRLSVTPKPTSATASTFVATIKAGHSSALVSGNVLFAVSDTPSQSKTKRTCAGGDLQPVSVNGGVATATCNLVAGWFVVPTNPPKGSWNVTAQYSGNADFASPANPASMSGSSKS
jgi:large repetitive protein